MDGCDYGHWVGGLVSLVSENPGQKGIGQIIVRRVFRVCRAIYARFDGDEARNTIREIVSEIGSILASK